MPREIIDGRCRGGNTPLGTLCRLAGEIAYTQKRVCLRREGEAQRLLTIAADAVEAAIKDIEKRDHGKGI